MTHACRTTRLVAEAARGFLGAVLFSGCSVLEVSPQAAMPGEKITITANMEATGKTIVMYEGGAYDDQAIVKSNNPPTIESIVPPGAQTGPVTVHSGQFCATSTFDFTVLTTERKETTTAKNNTKAVLAPFVTNAIPWGTRISGTLAPMSDVDWYVLEKTASGWASTIEILFDNQSDDELVIHVMDEPGADGQPQGFAEELIVAKTDAQKMWLTIVENEYVFLRVEHSGPPTIGHDAYSIDVAQIQLDDQREPNDELTNAPPLPQTDGAVAYLTPAWDPTTATVVGKFDHYEFAIPTTGFVHVVFASLATGYDSPIELRIVDANGGHIWTEYSPSGADPNALIDNLPIQAGQPGPWTLRVSTLQQGESFFGKYEGAPGRARIPYWLDLEMAHTTP